MSTTASLTDEMLAVRAAELYYDDNKTQDEIGALLGITRFKVGRLLASARQNGVVRIEIVHPRARRLPLERRLQQVYGLTDAVVVPSSDDPTELAHRIAQGAADHLRVLRPVPRTLGVSWGRTLHNVAESLDDGWATGVSVVQINGGVSLGRRSGVAAATAATIAQKGGGHATLLPSPAIFERLATKRAMESDRTIAAVLAQAATANAFLFSAGVADQTSALVESGYLGVDEMASLARAGAVGDVVGRIIGADGTVVDGELDARTVGLPLDLLRRADTAILVAGGEAKWAVVRAAVSSGLCTVLVTDESTALSLLSDTESPKGSS